MSFDRPWLLLALVALPVLWLLSKRLSARREAPVSSLLIWRRLGLASEPPREARRHADLLLLLGLLAAALTALGMAGPRVGRWAPPSVLHVLKDESPSMEAFSERASSAMEKIERDLPSGSSIGVHRAAGTGELAMVLALAGRGSVLVVTDHPLEKLSEPRRVRVWLVGEPVENVGIASAWIEEGGSGARFTAVVRNYGRVERSLAVDHPGGATRLVLGPGASEVVSGAAPGGRAEIWLRPGDRFSFDDRLEVVLEPAAGVGLRWTGADEPRLRAALELAGIAFEEEEDGPSLAYGRVSDETTRILVAPPGERRPVRPGTLSAGGGLPTDAVPGPRTVLGRAAPLDGKGTVLLADDAGPLALIREGGRVEVALDPGDPASTWSSDPSFPIFWEEIGILLGARPATSAPVGAAPDHEESATRASGGPWDLDGVAPSRGGADEGTALAPVLLAVAAALVGALILLSRSAR